MNGHYIYKMNLGLILENPLYYVADNVRFYTLR